MNATCHCGHVRDEHELRPSTACTVEGCDCLMFERDPEADTPDEAPDTEEWTEDGDTEDEIASDSEGLEEEAEEDEQ